MVEPLTLSESKANNWFHPTHKIVVSILTSTYKLNQKEGISLPQFEDLDPKASKYIDDVRRSLMKYPVHDNNTSLYNLENSPKVDEI